MVTVVAVLAVAVAAGAVIQGSIGFGYALVAVPAMVLLLPWAVAVGRSRDAPLLGPPYDPAHEREGMAFYRPGRLRPDHRGRLLGTVAGVVLLVLAPKDYLSMLTGVLILAAALGSFLKPAFEVNDGTRLAGGVASGIVGTVAALGGTPLALVYQDRSGAELRSTLAISFVVGIAMSLVGLGLAGQVEGKHVILALQLLPCMLIGLWVSQWVVERLEERWLRPAVLTFAAVAGLVIIVLGYQG